MNNREKFIQSLQAGKFKNGLKNGEITVDERLGTIKDYSKEQEAKDLQRFKSFMNSSAYDEIKDVEIPSYYGDEEI